MAIKSVSPDILDRLKKTAPEISFVEQIQVSCDGGNDALGHPRVFYTIGDDGYVECQYCDRAFVYTPRQGLPA